MRPLFIAKVRYTKQLENGTFKRVTEQYVLEAMTFGHAEERIFTELNHVKSEIILDDLKRTSFNDMFFGYVGEQDEPLYVQAKVCIKTFGNGESPKAIPYKFLIRVKDFSEAEGYLNQLIDTVGMDITDVETQALSKTPFVDYFPMSEAESEAQKTAEEIKVKITHNGQTVETTMDKLNQGLNSSIGNRLESMLESED
jgi:hypothetical protein